MYFTDKTEPVVGTLSIDLKESCIIIHASKGTSMYPMAKVRKITWL